MKRIVDIVLGALSGVIANAVWIWGVVVVPLVVTTVSGALGAAVPYVAYALAVGWGLTLLFFIWWFRNHTRRRAERITMLGKLLVLNDRNINDLIGPAPKNLKEPVEARERITCMLNTLCDTLEYRIPSVEKGATVLAYHEDRQCCFSMFTHVRHDDKSVGAEIKSQLTKDNSLAGQCLLVKETVLVVKDCTKSSKGSPWQQNHTPPRYVGRAAAPIQLIADDGTTVNIGALCFDSKRPLNLSTEDQRIMLLAADQIAVLWVLWQPDNHHTHVVSSNPKARPYGPARKRR